MVKYELLLVRSSGDFLDALPGKAGPDDSLAKNVLASGADSGVCANGQSRGSLSPLLDAFSKVGFVWGQPHSLLVEWSVPAG